MYSRKKKDIDEVWLRKRYMEDLASTEVIAKEAGCSRALIQKLVSANGWKRKKTMSKPVWNKGKTKETDERVREQANARLGSGNPMYGREAWNTGLTKDTSDRVAGVSEKMAGRAKTDEHKKKLAERKTGLRGEEANRWNGGVSSVTEGYITRICYREDGSNYYEYEHRIVAVEFLGRPLKDEEHVHHIDFDVKNNEPCNLLVLGAGAHRLLHVAIKKSGDASKEFQIGWLADNGYEYVYGGEV
ncbi:HNH endonuclease [Klebsiella grimontii]|uniref:HNH endonuclease n=1 Tax=Klebsiella grimontii TaxID=2058152 RepID=UPI001667FEF0|nr:HNH endonuclease [Klebsiella grimontii]MBD0905737.1 HNH endonuclease [Klebsiella grimontii]